MVARILLSHEVRNLQVLELVQGHLHHPTPPEGESAHWSWSSLMEYKGRRRCLGLDVAAMLLHRKRNQEIGGPPVNTNLPPLR